MSLYDPVTPERLLQLLRRLAQLYRESGSIYLVGGTGLLYQHLKGLTKDVDLSARLPPVAQTRFSAIVHQLSRELNMAIEEVSPADFIPLPDGVETRHRYLGRQGNLEVYAFDPLSTALAKIARGRASDYADVRALIAASQISRDQLSTALDEILPRVAAGGALKITPEVFRMHMADFFDTLSALEHIHNTTLPVAETPQVDAIDTLTVEYQQLVEKMQSTHPLTPLDKVDALALREFALTHPEADRSVLRAILLQSSPIIEAGLVTDSETYADAIVARTLLAPEVRQARAAHDQKRNEEA